MLCLVPLLSRQNKGGESFEELHQSLNFLPQSIAVLMTHFYSCNWPFLKAGCLTLKSRRFTLYLFGSQSSCSEVIRQGLYVPSDRGSGWFLSFGKRLTWRRSQHGLVGREMTVNSGPFSQLPAETNTNDYLAIVSIEATRHL